MMMLVNRMARAGPGIEFARNEDQHGADDRHRKRKDQFLAERHGAERQGEDRGAECQAAAEDAPVDRPALAGLRRSAARRPRNTPDDHPSRKTVSRPKTLASQPEAPATARIRPTAPGGRSPAPCRARRAPPPPAGLAGAVEASDDLGGHRVGDHVLHDGADDDQIAPRM